MDAVTDNAAEPLPSWYQPTAQVATGLVFTDEAGRILLVKPTYNDVWHLPGGVVEAGESPAAAAIREVKEELGLDVEAGRLMGVDYRPPTPGGRGARFGSCSMAAHSPRRRSNASSCLPTRFANGDT